MSLTDKLQTPWRIAYAGEGIIDNIYGKIAAVTKDDDLAPAVVKIVNNHDQLVGVLQDLVDVVEDAHKRGHTVDSSACHPARETLRLLFEDNEVLTKRGAAASQAGVWCHMLDGYTGTVIAIYGSEIGALRAVNEAGYGVAQIIPFGVDCKEHQQQEYAK